MKLLNMTSLEEVRCMAGIDTTELWMDSAEKRKEILPRVSGGVVDNFISFQYTSCTLNSSKDKVRFYLEVMF